MSLRERLEALVGAAPSDATVPVRWIGELLAAEGDAPGIGTPSPDMRVDLTVPQVATRFGRSVSTVRTWLASGALPGSYRLHGREWRIPLAAIEAMQRTEATRPQPTPAPHHRTARTTDIGEWRKHLPTRGDTRAS